VGFFAIVNYASFFSMVAASDLSREGRWNRKGKNKIKKVLDTDNI
jgi:hypothetical protein